jgi:hypothetical protein
VLDAIANSLESFLVGSCVFSHLRDKKSVFFMCLQGFVYFFAKYVFSTSCVSNQVHKNAALFKKVDLELDKPLFRVSFRVKVI